MSEDTVSEAGEEDFLDDWDEDLGAWECMLLSEAALAECWLRPEEDEAWKDL
jgi:hypothetical protein